MFKLLIVIFSFSLNCFAQSNSNFVVVSDVDDTVKETNVGSKLHAAANGLFSGQMFPGMAELYEQIGTNSNSNPQTVFVSGSPKSLNGFLTRSLAKAGFAEFELILKDWSKGQDTISYKYETFEKINRTINKPLVLIGDDTEFDPIIFEKFMQNYPDQVKAAYVHVVTGKPLPANTIPFHSSFDIALNEFSEGRLSESQVIQIGESLKNYKPWGDIFPDYVTCPSNYTANLNLKKPISDQLKKVAIDLGQDIKSFCRDRNKYYESLSLNENQNEAKSCKGRYVDHQQLKLVDELKQIVDQSLNNKH